jgi:hypothetical protein
VEILLNSRLVWQLYPHLFVQGIYFENNTSLSFKGFTASCKFEANSIQSPRRLFEKKFEKNFLSLGTKNWNKLFNDILSILGLQNYFISDL